VDLERVIKTIIELFCSETIIGEDRYMVSMQVTIFQRTY
jgi:hypothetical protein